MRYTFLIEVIATKTIEAPTKEAALEFLNNNLPQNCRVLTGIRDIEGDVKYLTMEELKEKLKDLNECS